MKVAICGDIFRDVPLDQACETIASLGYEGIELAPFMFGRDLREFPEENWAGVARTAREHGLAVVGVHWLLSSPPGFSISTPDEETRAETIAFFQHLVRFTDAVGGRVMVFGSPQQRNFAPEWDPPAARQRAITLFQAVATSAEAHGVTLALEPLAPAVTNFMQTGEETLAIARAVGSPAVKLHLDTKAMATEDRPIPEIVRAVGKRWLAHVHLNDPNGRGPGMGALDFTPVVAALRDIDYEGWVSVETFDEAVPPAEIARQSMTYLRELGL